MLADNFYVSLPSNAAKFPKNTQSNFTTILENPIELIGNYQFALVEISNFSNFSINMGKVSYKNPYFLSGAYENRSQNIEFSLRLDNGLTLSQFCNKLNFEIHNSFVKEELLYRKKLAFCTDCEFIEQMQKLNDNKRNLERPILNVIKKGPELYEIIDNVESLFFNIFIKCNGIFDNTSKRFNFQNIEALKKYFQLLIIRVPIYFQDDLSAYCLNQSYILKNDSFLVDSSSVEKDWLVIDKKEINLKSLEDIYKKTSSITSEINAQDDLLNPKDFFFFLPYFKLLNSNTIAIQTDYEITFNGLIAQFLNNSNIFETLVTRTKVFNLIAYIQLTKYILVYTNIIEPQYYAEKSSSILRTVNIKAQKGENVIFFDNPQYLNLSQSRINTINIELKDTQGNYIEFNDKFSNIFISLHFRCVK